MPRLFRFTLMIPVLAILAGTGQAFAAELVMFHSDGCFWCELWDEEIGSVYNKTDEAVTAPLRRVDLDEILPGDLKKFDWVVFTPTFVVLENGREIGRIVGYPGAEFFWPILDNILIKIPGKAQVTIQLKGDQS